MADVPLGARGAAAIIEPRLAGFRGDLTVADGAARGGLALRDAEVGLQWLPSARGGQPQATEKGGLLYSVPPGLVSPPRARGPTPPPRPPGRAPAGRRR